MRKIVFTIMLFVLLTISLTACGEKKESEHTFLGKIIEVSETNIVVEPNADEEESKSADKFYIDLKNNDISYKVGMNVKITYVGGILESYPAQVRTIKIEINDN